MKGERIKVKTQENQGRNHNAQMSITWQRWHRRASSRVPSSRSSCARTADCAGLLDRPAVAG